MNAKSTQTSLDLPDDTEDYSGNTVPELIHLLNDAWCFEGLPPLEAEICKRLEAFHRQLSGSDASEVPNHGG
jgi:hypothetical protein